VSEEIKNADHIFSVLEANKLPDSSIYIPVAGGSYFEHMGGVKMADYWLSKKFDNRDECFVVTNAFFSMTGLLIKHKYKNEWKLEFDVAHLFQVKSTAQSIVAINHLVKYNCYSDAYSICRTALSRLNLLMLFAFNPKLFDEWLNNPKHEKYLDGHVRAELENNGIKTLPHLYEFSSEIIHGQVEGLANIGYLEMGLFPEHIGIANNIWVIFKFIIGMAYCVVLNMAILDFNGAELPDDVKEHQGLFNWFLEHYFVFNRIDHLFALMAEDRHMEKIGKDKYYAGGSFQFAEFATQLAKFYKKGQKKKLSKKYDI